MRLVSYLKAIVGCTDNSSSRYTLGGVKAEHRDGVSHLVATDGRQLVHVSYADEAADTDIVINGPTLSRAFSATSSRKRIPIFEQTSPTAVMLNGEGTATADIVEGRFPRWRDCFPEKPAVTQVSLCPELLTDVVNVFKQAKVESVRLYVGSPEEGVRFAATTSTGEVIRAILMPKEADIAADSPFPGEATK